MEGQARLREQTKLLDAVLEDMDQGLMMVDAGGVVRVCNERAIALLDLPAAMMRAQPTFDAVRQHQLAQRDFEKSPEAMQRWVAGGGLEMQAHIYERERPNGTVLEIRTVPLPDGGAVRTYTDITARKRTEERTAESEERLALALDAGSDGLWDCDIATGEAWSSERWWRMLGYEPGDLPSHASTWRALLHPEDAPLATRALAEHLDGDGAAYECEHPLRRRDGTWAWVLTRGKVVARDASGAPLRFVGTQIDITARKEAERQVAHMAAHDALTDLPNRTLFRDRLDRELARTRRDGGGFAVLACDLDRFKAINDAYGHPQGDRLLRAVADRLRAVTGEADTVARLGGDEFAIILSRLHDPQRVGLAAQRIIEAVGQPIDLDGETATVGVSVGIALGAAECRDPDTLFKNADLALYRAKAAGRNTSSFYEPGMDAAVGVRVALERDLREAVRTGGLALHYQPIVRLDDDATAGFEALMRWRHPERGPVSPAEFIPLAEETGLIVPLGEWALREACREAAGWPGDVRIAVNVSAVQFRRPGLERAVVAALAASGLAPGRLELEITESTLLEDSEAVIACLHRLRGLGVRIALDDFGTGYSSLSYLRRFPFQKIKIDRSFVAEIHDADTAAIVQAIVCLGVRLGASITAEGVETAEQLERVREIGCTDVQGYLLGKPLPATDAKAFLCEHRHRSAA